MVDGEQPVPMREEPASQHPGFLGVVVILARRWRWLIRVPTATVIVASVLLFLTPNRYTASARIVPETRTVGGQLATVAALAGVPLSTAGSPQSPQFYADLLRSRPILNEVLTVKYALPNSGKIESDSASLLDFLRIEGKSLEERLTEGRKTLLSDLDVNVDPRTGVISLAVESRSPYLSAEITNEFVRQLLVFNRDSRQSQARARRIFIERRLGDAQRELAEAESGLRAFLERNRQYRDSPALLFEEGRLERGLQVARQLYLDLRQQLDAARIAEADDIPALTIIERAVPPTEKSGPMRRRIVTVVAVLSVVAAALAAVLYESNRARLRRGLPQLAAELRPHLPKVLAGGL